MDTYTFMVRCISRKSKKEYTKDFTLTQMANSIKDAEKNIKNELKQKGYKVQYIILAEERVTDKCFSVVV